MFETSNYIERYLCKPQTLVCLSYIARAATNNGANESELWVRFLLLLRSLPWTCSSSYLLRKAGIKQRQFVIMAPLTTSRLGSTINTREATPTMCSVSIPHTNMKSLRGGRRQDLNIQILRERMSVPTSGTQKAKNRHQVHATCSSGGSFTTNCLSRSENEHKWVISRSKVWYCMLEFISKS